MKKSIFLFAALWLFVIPMSNAQMKKGGIFMGVSSSFNIVGSMMGQSSDLFSLGFSSVKYKSDAPGFVESDPEKMTGLNAMPKIGYFIGNNFAAGLDLSIAYSKDKWGENPTISQTTFCIGPFLRYYVPAGKVSAFFEAGGLLGNISYKYKSGSNSSSDKSSLKSIGGGAGLAVPLGDKVSLDLMAGYDSFVVKSKDDNPDNERGIVGSVRFKFGFLIFLGSK